MNKDNEVYNIKDITLYDEFYRNDKEIYYPENEIEDTVEMDRYKNEMNENIFISNHVKRKTIVRVLSLTTGTLAIVLSFFFFMMRRINNNKESLVNDVSIELNGDALFCHFTLNNTFGIGVSYALENSEGEKVKVGNTTSNGDFNIIYNNLGFGTYKFIVYESIFGYELYYYESDYIIIE